MIITNLPQGSGHKEELVPGRMTSSCVFDGASTAAFLLPRPKIPHYGAVGKRFDFGIGVWRTGAPNYWGRHPLADRWGALLPT
jgi:hypothetical protein